MEVNKIKEIYPGHFQTILDFPSHDDLELILDKSYRYVWGIQHNEIKSNWENYGFTLFGKNNYKECYSRNIEMEFLIDTESFIGLIPSINQSVHLVQTNVLPPHYLNLRKLSGKTKYDMLKDKAEYLFEIKIPKASDYSSFISPNRNYLEMAVDRFKNRN